jgi:hypothetical protein
MPKHGGIALDKGLVVHAVSGIKRIVAKYTAELRGVFILNLTGFALKTAQHCLISR